MDDLTFIKQKKLGELISKENQSLSFTIFEIGALPLPGQQESFHFLLNIFPKSKIIAFEVDKALCQKLNQQATPGLEYHPIALARNSGKRIFYETNHPMCGSLYKPNENFISMYNGLDVAMQKSMGCLDALTMNDFMVQNDIKDIDFIKIDVQGAELEIFQGGSKALSEVVAIVSEVEFVPIYVNQPLFGDICTFLSKQGLMFHKFCGLAGRTLKPIVVNNDKFFPTQHMWSDAVFIRDICKLPQLSPDKLLKMGLLAYLYGSPDVAYNCFCNYDEKKQSNLQNIFLDLYNSR